MFVFDAGEDILFRPLLEGCGGLGRRRVLGFQLLQGLGRSCFTLRRRFQGVDLLGGVLRSKSHVLFASDDPVEFLGHNAIRLDVIVAKLSIRDGIVRQGISREGFKVHIFGEWGDRPNDGKELGK